MTDGGFTRTSNTGTVGREAEANTIAKGMHHDCQPACQDPNQQTQPGPVVAMPEFCLHSAVCRTVTEPTDQYIG